MSIALNKIFMMNTNKNDNNIPKPDNLRNYIKKGTMKENEIDELYKVTTKKLAENYKDRLSLLLYNGNKVNDYFSKRVNLDKVVYKISDEDKLYVTLEDFKKKDNSKSLNNSGNNKNNKNNSSFQNYTENISKYLTCDTNNRSNDNILSDKKDKLKLKEMYNRFKEERLNIEIKKLMLNENQEMPKNLEREIFEKLRNKYNFMQEEKKSPKIYLNAYGSKPRIKNFETFFDKKKKFSGSIGVINEKTKELNKLKSKKYKNYLSPIFFLGKTNDKYIHNISYSSHKKLLKVNNDKYINDLKKENNKYLQIMGKDINELHEINSNGKGIMTES